MQVLVFLPCKLVFFPCKLVINCCHSPSFKREALECAAVTPPAIPFFVKHRSLRDLHVLSK